MALCLHTAALNQKRVCTRKVLWVTFCLLVPTKFQTGNAINREEGTHDTLMDGTKNDPERQQGMCIFKLDNPPKQPTSLGGTKRAIVGGVGNVWAGYGIHGCGLTT